MQKKIFFFLGNFFSPPEKKGKLHAIFRDSQRSVAEPGPTPSPWSITLMFQMSIDVTQIIFVASL